MTNNIRFGLGIPNCREGRSVPAGFAGPKEIIEVSQLAEVLGFDVLWADDHLDASREIRNRDQIPPNLYEILITMSHVAAITKTIDLGIGVLVLPTREIVVTAKQLATLDVFSKGRVILGLGIGNREEFNAIMPKNKQSNRGKMLDEGIEALRLLFIEDEATFKGDYYEFNGVAMNPKPIQNPIPIYIAGSAPETLNRIAKWGDGCFVPRGLKALYKRIEELRPILKAAGRDILELDMTSRTILSIGNSREEAVDRLLKSRISNRFKGQMLEETIEQNLIGSVDEVIVAINKLKDGGMTQLVVQNIAASTFGEMVEQVKIFGQHVLPIFKN